MDLLPSIRTQEDLLLKAPLRPEVHRPLLRTLAGLKGRIGIFGGTFDPVHVGHPECAEIAMREFNLDMVIFVPVGWNPLKTTAPFAPKMIRLEMLMAVLRDKPAMFVSPTQLLGEVSNFTVDLLQHIHACSPEAELFLINGADILPDLHKWKGVHEILELAQPIFVPRKGSPVSGIAEGVTEFSSAERGRIARGWCSRSPDSPDASRELRSQLQKSRKRNDLLRAGLDPRVLRIIEERRLYPANT